MPKKKKQSDLVASVKLGIIGVIVALAITLFWPITYLPTLVLNSAIGFAVAFSISYVYRRLKKR